MAFICEGCIAPEFRDEFMFRLLSKGPCENCGYTDLCVDTKAGINPKWKENLHKDLIAAGIIPPETPLEDVTRLTHG